MNAVHHLKRPVLTIFVRQRRSKTAIISIPHSLYIIQLNVRSRQSIFFKIEYDGPLGLRRWRLHVRGVQHTAIRNVLITKCLFFVLY
jgi:hypothetical protein